jgi:NAD-dependent dihydropyrimidine dehydrogenase PreA subunit
MIEVIDTETCTDCNLCVSVCPTNVFQAVAGAPPVIARQDSCQTCFMCEVYCPVDALYVDPDPARVYGLTVEKVKESQSFGSYRRSIGWAKETRHLRQIDDHFRLPQ